MPISFFISYALPALFMACAGYYIPKTGLGEKEQYLAYTLCVLLTFVFKYYIDIFFKRKEKAQSDSEKKESARKITSLEKEVSRLNDEITNRELDHANELNSIERHLNNHLKTNYKCEENETLWVGVDSVIKTVETLSDSSRAKITKGKERANRKKSS